MQAVRADDLAALAERVDVAVHGADLVEPARPGSPSRWNRIRRKCSADDVQPGVGQEVVDVGDPAGDRVVDRDHRQVGLAALDRREDVLERRAGQRLQVRVVLAAHLVGVGARLALVGDASGGAGSVTGCIVVWETCCLDRRAHGAASPSPRSGRGAWLAPAPYAAAGAVTSTRCPRTSLGLRQEVAALRAEATGRPAPPRLSRYDAFGDVGGRLSWSLALRRRRRQRRRADRDPRPQRGAQLRQEPRRLDLRATAVAGGGGRRGVREAVNRDWDDLADELGVKAVADGEPTRWYDELWSAAERGEVALPWDHTDPHPVLADWVAGHGRRQRTGAPWSSGAGSAPTPSTWPGTAGAPRLRHLAGRGGGGPRPLPRLAGRLPRGRPARPRRRPARRVRPRGRDLHAAGAAPLPARARGRRRRTA